MPQRRSLPRATLRLLVMAAVCVGLMEAALRLGIGHLPPGVLLMLPDAIRWTYPDQTFERPYFRVIRRNELIDDPELGFRMAPHLSVDLKYPGAAYHLETDDHGFANVDPSLYEQADIVVAGDSLTMGALVQPGETWPRRLARATGLRVLSLATSNWDVYQYPRVLARYAGAARPRLILITLSNLNDFDTRYYAYADYRKSHPDVRGHYDYRLRQAQRFQWRPLEERQNGLFLLQNAKELLRGLLPFSFTSIAYIGRLAELPAVAEFEHHGHPFSAAFDTGPYAGAPTFPRIADVRADVDRIRQLAAALDVPLGFVYLPSPEELYIPLLPDATNLNAAAGRLKDAYVTDRLDLGRYASAWKQILGDDVPFWNATPPLRALAERRGPLTLVRDIHPLAEGHQAIAEFVERQLRGWPDVWPRSSSETR